MPWIDWSIVFLVLFFLTFAAIYTKKYTRSVADFLVANRCAGKYLLSVSEGMAGLGAITIIAGFEMFYKAGFAAVWWDLTRMVVVTIILMSGWVFYRYRQTRAMTLAQFLEIRYSKRFRIFAGLIAYLSGIINFGIFPSVGARFLIHFCGFPDTIYVYALIMIVLLAFAVLFTFIGGQIAVIVTGFFQGIFANIMFVIILFVVLSRFSWTQIFDALAIAPENASLIHPFKMAKTQDFNIWFFLILAFSIFYMQGIWQGSGAYNCSAMSAHEARMGKMLSTWHYIVPFSFMLLIPVCAYTFMHHPDFVTFRESANSLLVSIDDPQIRKQMTTIAAARSFVPIGIRGCFVAVMLAAFISTHDTYLHSWGSIFIQDVIMPFRKKPFSPKQHMKLLRISILGVALFIFCFSLIFRQTEYIYMFFMITGAIFTGGAGTAVIGGLYWRRGTTTAAWSAMITGSVLAVAAVIVRQIHQASPFTGGIMGYIASQNGAVLSFYASISAIIVYILASLLYKSEKFNLDKMLHRGQYAIKSDSHSKNDPPAKGVLTIIGITSEFSFKDKIVYILTVIWIGGWILVFVGGTIYNFTVKVSTESWIVLWKFYVRMILTLAAIVTIWFIFGGLADLKRMFSLLRTVKRSDLDDGTVMDHHNLDEISDDVEKKRSGEM